jgi:GTP-binding protein
VATWTRRGADRYTGTTDTVVRELRDDPRRAQDEWEAEEVAYAVLDREERRKLWQELLWVHCPTYEDDSTIRLAFKQDCDIWCAKREMRISRKRTSHPGPGPRTTRGGSPVL